MSTIKKRELLEGAASAYLTYLSSLPADDSAFEPVGTEQWKVKTHEERNRVLTRARHEGLSVIGQHIPKQLRAKAIDSFLRQTDSMTVAQVLRVASELRKQSRLAMSPHPERNALEVSRKVHEQEAKATLPLALALVCLTEQQDRYRRQRVSEVTDDAGAESGTMPPITRRFTADLIRHYYHFTQSIQVQEALQLQQFYSSVPQFQDLLQAARCIVVEKSKKLHQYANTMSPKQIDTLESLCTMFSKVDDFTSEWHLLSESPPLLDSADGVDRDVNHRPSAGHRHTDDKRFLHLVQQRFFPLTHAEGHDYNAPGPDVSYPGSGLESSTRLSMEDFAQIPHDPDALMEYSAELLAVTEAVALGEGSDDNPSVNQCKQLMNKTRIQWKKTIREWERAFEKEHGHPPSEEEEARIEDWQAAERSLVLNWSTLTSSASHSGSGGLQRGYLSCENLSLLSEGFDSPPMSDDDVGDDDDAASS